MELTMKRERVECCEKVFEYCAPAEEAAETVIPDTMPDVERVLCAGGTAIIRSKEVQEGRVSLTAGVSGHCASTRRRARWGQALRERGGAVLHQPGGAWA